MPVDNGPRQEKHWNGWPNSAGFNYPHDHHIPTKLEIQGFLPDYVAGNLYRTGPNAYKLARSQADAGMMAVSHWFDGFTTIHKFDAVAGRNGKCNEVWYSSYCQVDEQIEYARATGKLKGITFGQKRDPCDTLYQKFKSTFSSQADRSVRSSNIGVALRDTLPAEAATIPEASSRRLMTVVTDNTLAKTFDRDTLEPLGVTDQQTIHKSLSGPVSGAHAAHDPVTGDIFNYNLSFGSSATYKVFRTTSRGKTDILAEVRGADIKGAYLHSISLTPSFVVLCIWPAYFKTNGMSILWERNILDAMQFDPHAETVWVVIDRHHGGGVVKKFKSPAFFCFHTVNAWEEPIESKGNGAVNIVCELAEFKNMDILYHFYYNNLVSDQPGARQRDIGMTAPRLARYRLTGVPNEGVSSNSKGRAERIMYVDGGDLPRINPHYALKPHRYVYTVLDRGHSSFLDGIGKTDMVTGETAVWEYARHTPGEPIFVPAPGNGKEEDDGVILCVVLDGDAGSSYLLCLDAKTMKELGRALVGVPVGFGFHGTHLPASQ